LCCTHKNGKWRVAPSSFALLPHPHRLQNVIKKCQYAKAVYIRLRVDNNYNPID